MAALTDANLKGIIKTALSDAGCAKSKIDKCADEVFGSLINADAFYPDSTQSLRIELSNTSGALADCVEMPPWGGVWVERNAAGRWLAVEFESGVWL